MTTSFGARDAEDGFSWLHGLSALTTVSTTVAIVAARKHDAVPHVACMIGTYRFPHLHGGVVQRRARLGA